MIQVWSSGSETWEDVFNSPAITGYVPGLLMLEGHVKHVGNNRFYHFKDDLNRWFRFKLKE